jgi:hypothetical protein
MTGWVISALGSSGTGGSAIIQSYGNSSSFFYFDNSVQKIARGRIVTFTPSGMMATLVVDTGNSDVSPVTLSYAPL